MSINQIHSLCKIKFYALFSFNIQVKLDKLSHWKMCKQSLGIKFLISKKTKKTLEARCQSLKFLERQKPDQPG